LLPRTTFEPTVGSPPQLSHLGARVAVDESWDRHEIASVGAATRFLKTTCASAENTARFSPERHDVRALLRGRGRDAGRGPAACAQGFHRLHLRTPNPKLFWFVAMSRQLIKLDMRKRSLAQVFLGAILIVASCGRDGLTVPSRTDGAAGRTGSRGAGGTTGGGSLGALLPDGGLAALLGDGGAGQLICGPEVRLGASCSGTVPVCLLPSLGGVCACVSGNYLCPVSTAPPSDCPLGAATGVSCKSPLSICMGGSAVGCLCGMGTYTCLI
jgi:hypothetical protein